MDAANDPTAQAPAKPKKSGWESLMTMTPVVLAVMGTVLAGTSTSEMTLAQYYRTLAAQSQSKAADQWQFFQVKRIRGTSLENTFDLLPWYAQTGKFDAVQLQAAASRLLDCLELREHAADQVDRDLAKLQERLSPARLEALQKASGQFRQEGTEQAAQAKQARAALNQQLAKPELQAVLKTLGRRRPPEVTLRALPEGPIPQALAALAEGQNEAQLAPLLLQIKPWELQEAIEGAEANYQAIDDAGRGTTVALKGLEATVNTQLDLARTFRQQLRGLRNLLGDLRLRDSIKQGEMSSATVLTLLEEQLDGAASELNLRVKGAQHHTAGFRYRVEGDYNQKTAQLYEIQVRMNNVTAERHRHRSRLFFLGLLLAQAGTAIASLSLAARQQSLLWAIASVAGLAALGFSLYVYLSV